MNSYAHCKPQMIIYNYNFDINFNKKFIKISI